MTYPSTTLFPGADTFPSDPVVPIDNPPGEAAVLTVTVTTVGLTVTTTTAV